MESQLDRKRFKRYKLAEIYQFPEPEWLIEDVFYSGTLNMIFGPPETCKTFVALDMAMCIAHGKKWHGKKVKQGNVLYVCAEGAPLIGARYRAWEQENNITVTENIDIILDAPQMYQLSDIKIFLDSLKGEQFSMIFFDTFSRTMDGANENSSEDVTKWINTASKLQKLNHAAVCAVHHLGKQKDKGARGHSSFKSACDTMIEVKRVGGKGSNNIKLVCDKLKDAEHFDDFDLVTKEKTLSSGNTSLVMVDGIEKEEQPTGKEKEALERLAGLRDASFKLWCGSTADRTFRNYSTWLQDHGYVKKSEGNKGTFSLTMKGQSVFLPEIEEE